MWMDSSHEWVAMDTSQVHDSGHDYITQNY